MGSPRLCPDAPVLPREEFAEFLASRVLTSPRLIREMCSGTYRVAFRKSVRAAVPLMPESILDAAIGAFISIGVLRCGPLEPQEMGWLGSVYS